MGECTLNLLTLCELEHALIDYLLDYRSDLVFISHGVDYHGLPDAELAPAEQVTGRQQRLLISIQLSADEAQALAHELSRVFQGADIRYWITPVLNAGVLQSIPAPGSE